MMRPDCLIFDMDGTLWDATDSYARTWNETSRRLGFESNVTGRSLLSLMGKPLADIFDSLFPEGMPVDKETYMMRLMAVEAELMPLIGGRLMDGVEQGLRRLARHYPLMMVSNCSATGLRNFLAYTKLHDCFVDTLTNGETRLPKAENIQLIMRRNGADSAVYVGDTQQDCDETHRAGQQFAFVEYGFGRCADADIRFATFTRLVNYFVTLK